MSMKKRNLERKRIAKNKKIFQPAIDQIDYLIDDLIYYIEGEDDVIDYIQTFRKLIKEWVKKQVITGFYLDFPDFKDPFTIVRSKIECALYTRGTHQFPYPEAPSCKNRYITFDWMNDRNRNYQKKSKFEREHHEWLKTILETDGKDKFVEIVNKYIEEKAA